MRSRFKDQAAARLAFGRKVVRGNAAQHFSSDTGSSGNLLPGTYSTGGNTQPILFQGQALTGSPMSLSFSPDVPSLLQVVARTEWFSNDGTTINVKWGISLSPSDVDGVQQVSTRGYFAGGGAGAGSDARPANVYADEISHIFRLAPGILYVASMIWITNNFGVQHSTDPAEHYIEGLLIPIGAAA